jgi:hypothetical protein
MSHTTKLEGASIKSASAIRAAVDALRSKGIKASVLENAKPRAYFSNQIDKCDLVMKLEDGPYDVGFKLNDQGEYEVLYDNYINRVSELIGSKGEGTVAEVGQFMQEYVKEATIEQATNQGFMVESCEMNEHGEYELNINTN